MASRLVRLLRMSSVAVLLAGCQDPLEPDLDRALLESQGGRGTTTDPQSTPWSPTNITVFWTDNLSNEAGWEIHRSTTGREGAYSLLAHTDANVTNYGDAGLTPLTEYCYRIRSFRINGRKTAFAAFTIATCATTLGVPIAATAVRATPVPFGQIDIVWTFGATTAHGFRIERAATGDGPWLNLGTLPSSDRYYRDTGRPNEQQACYRIIAVNNAGDAPPSNVACTTPPAAPSQLVAESPEAQSISLSWQDNSAAEDGFEVQRAGEDLVWSVIATLPADTRGYDDRGLATNTQHWYKVRATKDGGFSPFSDPTSAATASTAPDAPSWVGASPVGSAAVSVTWSLDSKLAEEYRAERSFGGGAPWIPLNPATFGSNWLYDEGLPSDQHVCYRVLALNRLGDSPPSAEVCTAPPAAASMLRTAPIDDQMVEHSWLDNSTVEDSYELWLYGFDGWDYYYYPVYLEANSTSYQGSSSEAVYGLLAMKDGGYSDWAFPVEVTAAALQNRTAATRRPPASVQRIPPRSAIQKGVGR